MDEPPSEATTPYLIKHLVQSSHAINPGFYAAYFQPSQEGTLNFTLEELINKFNISYTPPKENRVAYPSLARESTDPQQDIPPNTTSDTNQRRKECFACGGNHPVKRCRNLFEELRPDGWVVNEHQERRCQQYLKTSEGKALYQEQKKHFAAYPPEKPTLEPSSKKRKASESPESQDPESPHLSSA